MDDLDISDGGRKELCFNLSSNKKNLHSFQNFSEFWLLSRVFVVLNLHNLSIINNRLERFIAESINQHILKFTKKMLS